MGTDDITKARAIKMAIQLEKDGMKFFTEAAKRTSSESGKKIFRTLAKEEAIHLEVATGKAQASQRRVARAGQAQVVARLNL